MVKKEINSDEGESRNNFPDDCDVPEPLWIRRNTNDVNRINWLLFKSQLSFVLPIGIILWIIFILIKN